MKRLIHTYLLLFVINFLTAQTIESLLSPPFPTNLITSKEGNKIAWVFNDQGSRNVYLAKAPDFVAQKITHYTGDDGMDLTNLQFDPTGENMYYVRGNPPNGRGETANPAFLQTSTARNIFKINLTTNEVKNIQAGAYYKISQDGKTLVYASGGQIYALNPHSDSPKGEKLFQIRGGQSNVQFSPDGSMIAFVSDRSDHAFIGVYTMNTKSVRFIDADMDYDGHITWSPDSKQIAFIRIPNKHDLLPFIPQREHSPWSIRIYNLTTNEGKEIWRADKGIGSVLCDDIPTEENLLWWTATDQIIFPWEKDGWQHLYAIDIKSKQVKLLTPGKGEVENVKLSNDRSSVFYTCNINDIERRHIWQYNFNTQLNTQLFNDAEIQWNPAELANGLAYIYSNATRPAWPSILINGATKDLAPDLFPSAFPSNLVTPQLVNIKGTDGKTCYGDLFIPPDHRPGDKHPAVIFIHGGSRRQMLLGFNYGSYYSNAYALNQYLASKGYVVLALNFRSGIGYGFDFREAIGYGADDASEYYDLLGAGLYLKSRPDVISNKIGLWGGSYGGYLTAHGLARASHVFACGVDIHGVHDWNTEMPTFAPHYTTYQFPEVAAKAKTSSPLYYIKGWKNPVLMIHGDDDRNVPISESVVLLEKLRKQGVEVETMILPDEVHGFLLHSNWLKVYKGTVDFLDRKLK